MTAREDALTAAYALARAAYAAADAAHDATYHIAYNAYKAEKARIDKEYPQ